MIKSIDTMRADAEEFAASDPELMEPEKPAPVLYEAPAPEPEPSHEGEGGELAVVPSVPEEAQVSMKSTEFMNGSKFYQGELLPWKGVLFQVIFLKNQTVALQAIDLTGASRKRMGLKRA